MNRFITCAAAACLVIAGCVSTGGSETSEHRVPSNALVEEFDDRQGRRILWADRFKQDRRRCEAAGRKIVIMASRSTRRSRSRWREAPQST